MARLNDLGQSNTPSFKSGKPAFRKRRKIAEAIVKKEPELPMDDKFAIATATTKKLFKKKNV